MSMSAQTLTQARETMIAAAEQRLSLLAQIKEQGRKITELEREVQRQMTARASAEQALQAARQELDALRTQVPSERAQSAFESLTQYLVSPADIHPELRIAA